MAKQNVLIQRRGLPPLLVVADVRDGLAIHREETGWKDWTVTHVASGYGIPVPAVYSARHARRRLDAMLWRTVLLETAPRGFWTQGKEAIASRLGHDYYQQAQVDYKERALREDCGRAAARHNKRETGYQAVAACIAKGA